MFEGYSSAWLEIKGVKARIAVDQVKAIERTFVYAEPTPSGSDEPFRIIERTRYDGTLQIGNASVHYRLSPRELPTPKGWIRARIGIVQEYRPAKASFLLPSYLGARNVKASTFHDIEVNARRFADWKALAIRSSLTLGRDEREEFGRAVDDIWELEGERFTRELRLRYRESKRIRGFFGNYLWYRWPDRVRPSCANPSRLAAMLDWVGRRFTGSRAE
ncbi:hypothetical protein [Singulisphaera sp. PoT]|uniref:hypothetical protein n=1 Tax=Singulisphaera sp. PoT TaxID=3411797 RepID=UPI003BF581E4